MDSTPANPIQPRPLLSSIRPSSAKLPIKRKTPDSSSSAPVPIPNSPIAPTAKTESPIADHDTNPDRPPPFKFHRIWTEPDEIRFLRGLLDCSSQGLLFPRDLGVFYARFSNNMLQPYTKSQLAEKMRRLRKKFRVVSSRLSKGLDKVVLSSHDRELYDLSKRLWHPDYSSSSPFTAADSDPNRSKLIGVKVLFSPTLPSTAVLALPPASNPDAFEKSDDYDDNDKAAGDDDDDDGFDGDVKLREANVELEEEAGGRRELLVSAAMRTVVEVFDQSLEEIAAVIDPRRACSQGGRLKSLEEQWREQRVAEFHVLAKRLRLALSTIPCHSR